MAGIYVHIPFCASRCIYCGFYSTAGLTDLQDAYVDALIKEHNMRSYYLKGDDINTIYIGGGTPSLLSLNNIAYISKYIFPKKGLKEFTMECNPDDVSPTLAQAMKSAGVNRVSMGVQTFSDERLGFLKRRHKSADIEKAVKTLRNAGIRNISIDLMFGFPDETTKEWKDDIERAVALNVEHISAYSLMYEEGTTLYRMLEEGKIKENDEERSAEMYDVLINTLIGAGYEHYEISNFAKPGFRSLHNSSYWNGTKYLGLGAAAHSYDGDSRQWNVSDIRKYIDAINRGIVPMEKEEIDETTRYNDTITTALRTKEGIDLAMLSTTHYIYIKENARKAIDNGLLQICDNHLSLTRKGLYVSDDVMSDLIILE